MTMPKPSEPTVCSGCSRPLGPLRPLDLWIQEMLRNGSRLYCSADCALAAERSRSMRSGEQSSSELTVPGS